MQKIIILGLMIGGCISVWAAQRLTACVMHQKKGSKPLVLDYVGCNAGEKATEKCKKCWDIHTHMNDQRAYCYVRAYSLKYQIKKKHFIGSTPCKSGNAKQCCQKAFPITGKWMYQNGKSEKSDDSKTIDKKGETK